VRLCLRDEEEDDVEDEVEERAGAGSGRGRGGSEERAGKLVWAGACPCSPPATATADLDGTAAFATTAVLVKRRRAYRALPSKGRVYCKIEGCIVPCDTSYSARIKVCPEHTKIPEVVLMGVASRFCHKCSKFHDLNAFESSGHTCSVWLARLRDEYHRQGGKKKKKTVSPPSLGVHASTSEWLARDPTVDIGGEDAVHFIYTHGACKRLKQKNKP
jgi:hypothetical protein